MNKELSANSTLSHYRILSKIGEGGMGEVYLAQDSRLRRKVALKVLPENIASDKERLRRFEQEAFAASALNHPNILTIFEFGTENETHFLATEYVEGETLREKLKNNEIGLTEALNITEQIAFALSAAHSAGIVHRDLKPENVMIRRDSIVKLLDFGLAKLIEKKDASPDTEAETRALVKTNPGVVMGTAAYMSPEQARGKKTDARSDIWSLGVVLYEMLTGRQPFTGETTTDTLAAILNKELPPLSGNTSSELQRIVRKALQKDKDERYQTIKDLWIDLKNLKRELEIAEEIERSAIPAFAKSAKTGANQSGENATAINQAAISTQDAVAAPTGSSAEYIVGEVKKHKFAWLGVSAALIIALFIGGYYTFFAKRAGTFDSVAVLPFVNATGDQETEFLSEGISETLINNFTRIPSLRVTARSTAFRYKGKETDPQTIGRELNVGAILTGKVLQRGDSLSVQVDLINAADGTQIWGNQYNGKVAEILDIQQKIARDVSEQLKLKLSGAQEQQITKNYTQNPQAYQHYLKGRFYWNRRTVENLRKAIQEFQRSVEIDPNYALAFVGLADSYVVLEEYAGTPSSETLPQAKAFAKRALEIDDRLAEAHTSVASVNRHLWQWEEAEKAFKRAIELNPNYPTAHHWYQLCLRNMERHDEALAEIKRAQELDPLSNIINANVVVAYLMKGDNNAALEQSKKNIEMDPNSWIGHHYMGLVYIRQGRYDEAVRKLQESAALSQRSNRSLGDLGYALAISGKKADALAIIKEMEDRYEKREMLGLFIGAVYAGLGEKDKAFAWLEKDFQTRSGVLPQITSFIPYDPLRDDPRYADLLRRMNLRQ
jgi:eukaryotic-like serine/threonine-protein kinase